MRRGLLQPTIITHNHIQFCARSQVTYGINALGLGPNMMGLLLTAGFLGVYFGSSYYTKKWIMANRDPDEPLQPAKSFKELKIVKTE